MNHLILLIVFVVSALAGYKLISNVPGLLHTPLMSGMNAVSGLTIIGALAAAIAAVRLENKILGIIAVFFAITNVTAGFLITGRMLNMFSRKTDPGRDADDKP